MELLNAGKYTEAYKQFILELEINKNGKNDPKIMNKLISKLWDIDSRGDAQTIDWLKERAISGNSFAQCELGWFYRTNQKNITEAIRWYKLSSDQDNAVAQCCLGHIYLNESNQDKKEGPKYYKMSADKKFSFGQFNTGRIYQNGQSVEKNYNEALRWYVAAHNSGKDDAIDAIMELLPQIKDTVLLRDICTKYANHDRVVEKNEALQKHNMDLQTEIEYMPGGKGYESAKKDAEKCFAQIASHIPATSVADAGL